jgi:hypothetical protein
VVNALSTKDNPEDGHRIRTETCRVFNDAFTKHFSSFSVLINVNVKVCFEISA